MSNEERKHKINVRDWIVLSTVMIGAVLTILALIWSNPPSTGIISVTFLLMLAFIFFVNSVTSNSKAHFEADLGDVSEKRINRFVTFAEYSFGLGFTFVISGFTILGYKYLLGPSKEFIALILPITFLVITWIIIIIYNIINYAGKAFKALRSLKRNLWILLELICLVIIFFDFFEIITIP
ncbi:MAG: hypothetical protein ACFFDN_24040 [Candidatus Hodarchaeota archaeon]